MDVLLFNASYGEGGARENIVVNIFIIDKIFVWKPRRRLPRFLIYAKRRRGFWGVFRSEENRDSELIKFDTRRSRNIEKGGPKEERRVCYPRPTKPWTCPRGSRDSLISLRTRGCVKIYCGDKTVHNSPGKRDSFFESKRESKARFRDFYRC